MPTVVSVPIAVPKPPVFRTSTGRSLAAIRSRPMRFYAILLGLKQYTDYVRKRYGRKINIIAAANASFDR